MTYNWAPYLESAHILNMLDVAEEKAVEEQAEATLAKVPMFRWGYETGSGIKVPPEPPVAAAAVAKKTGKAAVKATAVQR